MKQFTSPMHSPHGVDEKVAPELLNNLAMLTGLLPDNKKAMIEERFSGEHSEDFCQGLLAGYIHARDIFTTDPEDFFVGWMDCIATMIASEMMKRREGEHEPTTAT